MTTDAVESFVLRPLGLNLGVAGHEFRSRTRGRHALLWLLPWVLGLVLAMLSGVWYSHRLLSTQSVPIDRIPACRALPLECLLGVEAGLLLLLLPMQAAAAITMEREKRRMDALRASLLTPWEIVTAKLASLLALAVLLALLAVPLAAACLLSGGLDGWVVFFGQTLLLATAFWAITLGLAFSACSRTTVSAISCTYMVGVAAAVLPPTAGFAASYYAAQLTRGPLRERLELAAGNIVLAALAAIVVAVLCSWSARVLLLWRRAPVVWARRIAAAVGVLVACTFLVAAARHFISNAATEHDWFLVCCPWAAMAGILDVDTARHLTCAYQQGGATVGSAAPRWLLWAVATSATLAAGLVNWRLAARLLAWSMDRERQGDGAMALRLRPGPRGPEPDRGSGRAARRQRLRARRPRAWGRPRPTACRLEACGPRDGRAQRRPAKRPRALGTAVTPTVPTTRHGGTL